jgi:lipoyl(octanoyl) transferase
MIDYEKAYEIQLDLLYKRQKKEINDSLLILEHPAVITLGRGAVESNILISEKELASKNIKKFYVERGGDVTFHNPGQIVGYLIIDLNNHGKDVKLLVWKIENFIINMLKKEYGINASRIDGLRGVWVGNAKIAALGISVKKWITMHGFAINADNDLDVFKLIIPCGIKDRKVTSIKELIGESIDKDKLKKYIASYFADEFGYTKNTYRKYREK